MARPASLDTSPWLPAYGWWPPRADYDVHVLLSPYHAAVEEEALFEFTLRAYAGSPDPVWETAVGRLGLPDQRDIPLRSLDIPDAPTPHGGILEVHGIRLDRQPRKGVGFVGMWIDAHGPDGGGYIIPTIPIRGQAKALKRDDLQVVPGIVSTRDVDTELVLLNITDERTLVRLVVSSPDGLLAEGEEFQLEPWGAWRGVLSNHVRRLRQLLAESDGVGSLAIYSSHRLLPYFGFRGPSRPLVSLDHAAPIFA